MARVDQASYRPWEGTARPSPLVIFSIAGTMIRRLMRLRLVRVLVMIVSFIAIVLSSFLFGLGAIAGDGPMGHMFRRASPEVDMLALALRAMYPQVLFFAVLMAAVVGAPLIAEDRRAHALPLYFSRPITHLDYVLGKLLSLAFFLALLLIAPTIVMYLVELGFSQEEGIWRTRMPTFRNGLVFGAIGTVLFSSLALGVSSITERTNHAALLLFGLAMFAALLGGIAQSIDQPAWQAVSPTACLRRIAMDLLPMPDVMNVRLDKVSDMPVASAWTGIGAWMAASLAVLFARIRKVEVVS